MLPDHITRFFARLDHALDGMSAETRIKWLTTQRDSWEGLFQAYMARIDRGSAHDIRVRAEDYVLTIGGLDTRLAQALREFAEHSAKLSAEIKRSVSIAREHLRESQSLLARLPADQDGTKDRV